jgi:hypothetical protein
MYGGKEIVKIPIFALNSNMLNIKCFALLGLTKIVLRTVRRALPTLLYCALSELFTLNGNMLNSYQIIKK